MAVCSAVTLAYPSAEAAFARPPYCCLPRAAWWPLACHPACQPAAHRHQPAAFRASLTQVVTDTLNAVSAKLTTAVLLDLDKQIITDKKDPATVAKDFLSSNGLG